MPAPATIRWVGDETGRVDLLDQTALPERVTVLEVHDEDAMADAIRRLVVRGAPAIGVAAAYGAVLGLRDLPADAEAFRARFAAVAARLAAARPTAVNLGWALDRLARRLDRERGAPPALRAALLDEARAIHREDEASCAALGEHGALLIEDGDRILTHCNTGALATAGRGTALAVLFAARDAGKRFEVFVDETRPLLQGARLTSWELMQADIPCTLICDSAAAHVMKSRGLTRVFVGADRIAANGDVANKIGTYSVALLARAHGIPFHVVAPRSTFDPALPDGAAIPIEERSGDEITAGFGRRTAPEGVRTLAPAFDVTPADLITSIVTEVGPIRPVTRATVAAALARP